jgi:hypothetical protein
MSCLSYLLEQPGATINMNLNGMGSGTIQYKCDRRRSCSLASTMRIGPGHTHPRENWLFCSNVVHTNDGAFDIINATYEGLSQHSMPTGGYAIGTMQSPIPVHPNYKGLTGSFAGPIGLGTSPNEFGRILHEDGGFKAFGPLPDGEHGRPQPSGAVGARELEGTENFLQPGQLVFKYSAINTQRNNANCGPKMTKQQSGRLAQRHMSKLGSIVHPSSRSIPYISPPYEGANWILSNISEDVKTQNGGNVKYFTTNLEFLASGPGGWNPLLYQNKGSVSLP